MRLFPEAVEAVKTTDDYTANYLLDCYGAMSGADITEVFFASWPRNSIGGKNIPPLDSKFS